MTLAKLRKHLALFAKRHLYRAGTWHWTELTARPPRIRGRAASKVCRAAVVGVGAQGVKQCVALINLKGIQLVAVADRDAVRMKQVITDLHGPAEVQGFEDTDKMLSESKPLDLVSIATTAPSHLSLARLAISRGVPLVLIEKPLSTSLREARLLINDCHTKRVRVVVNYSRRWMPEYLAIKRCVDSGLIGEPQQISAVVGKGNLAMHASHYFDLCCFLLHDQPCEVFARLTTPSEPNPRGPQFQDPSGYALFKFSRGGRAFVDFSSSYGTKHAHVTLTGSEGRITIDERFGTWTLSGFGMRSWTNAFSDALKAGPAFARVVASALSGDSVDGCDGLWALEMIYGASRSSRENIAIALPMAPNCADLEYLFP